MFLPLHNSDWGGLYKHLSKTGSFLLATVSVDYLLPSTACVCRAKISYLRAEYSWVMFYFNPPFQLEHFQLLSPWLITDKAIVLFSVYLVLPHVL